MKKNTNLKKNLVKKSILPAAFAVLGSSIALTSVTYAWFTQGDNAQIDSIDVNVAAADGMQFSTGAVNSTSGELWLSTIAGSEFKGKPGNLTPESVNPISSNGKFVAQNSLLEFYLGTVESDTYTSVIDASNYYKLDLYVKMDKNYDFVLDMNSTVTFNTTDKGIQNAVRVAFLDLGCSSVSLEDAKTYGIGTKLGTGEETSSPVIWEPNHDQHTAAIEGLLPEGHTWNDEESKGIKAFNTAFAGKTLSELSSTNGTDESTPCLSEPVTTKKTATKGTPDKDVKICQVNKGINKIRMFIWIEGQDTDCKNVAADSKFTVNLKFKKTAIGG